MSNESLLNVYGTSVTLAYERMSLDELDEYMLIRRSKFDSTPAGTVTVPESKIYTTSECTALFLDKQMRVR